MLLKLSENFRDRDSKLLFYKGEKVFDEIDEGIENMSYRVIEKDNRHYLLLGEDI
ncbi:hypothetical protein D3C81_2303450 [compost metagenome]